ncbi:MAG: hypothetical protein KAR54_02135 [Candidatus Pacebacteria bacterium]|nr:hypothetical protein [Candidatus Paceibacterota bacterium]
MKITKKRLVCFILGFPWIFIGGLIFPFINRSEQSLDKELVLGMLIWLIFFFCLWFFGIKKGWFKKTNNTEIQE